MFYDAAQFPVEMQGSAFVALKGSWNRSEPTGYKVVRVPFKDGKPVGYYENFMTGFWASGEQRAEVWGRPAALAIAKDGSLLVADDTGGTIWKVRYTGEAPAGAPAAATTGTGDGTDQEVSTHGARDRPPTGRPASADRRRSRPVQSPCLCGRCARLCTCVADHTWNMVGSHTPSETLRRRA